MTFWHFTFVFTHILFLLLPHTMMHIFHYLVTYFDVDHHCILWPYLATGFWPRKLDILLILHIFSVQLIYICTVHIFMYLTLGTSRNLYNFSKLESVSTHISLSRSFYIISDLLFMFIWNGKICSRHFNYLAVLN